MLLRGLTSLLVPVDDKASSAAEPTAGTDAAAAPAGEDAVPAAGAGDLATGISVAPAETTVEVPDIPDGEEFSIAVPMHSSAPQQMAMSEVVSNA